MKLVPNQTRIVVVDRNSGRREPGLYLGIPPGRNFSRVQLDSGGLVSVSRGVGWASYRLEAEAA